MQKIELPATVKSKIANAALLTLFLTITPAAYGESSTEANDSASESSQIAVPEEYKDQGIHAAVFDNWPPDEWVGDGGELKGFAVDLARMVAKKLDVEITFTPTSFDVIIPAINNGRFDLGVASFAVTKQRLTAVDFVTISKNQQTMGFKRNSDIKTGSKASLCGRKVGVVTGTAEIQKINAISDEVCKAGGLPPVELSIFPNPSAMRLAVDSGRTEMFSMGYAQLQYLLNKRPDLAAGQVGINPVYQSWAVRQNNPLGPAILQAINALIESGEYAELMAGKWNLDRALIDESRLFKEGDPEESLVP